MERDSRNEKFFSRKRSFTFGAYGGRPEPLEHSILDILDSPTSETKPFLSAGSNQKVTELFEIIEKLQSQLLKIGRDLPLILPPKLGGYWIDPPLQKFAETSPTSSHYGLDPETYDIMERDSEATYYQEFFRSRYHHSFTAVDPSLGPLLLSVCLEEEEKRLRVILRMRECSMHGVFSVSLFPNIPSAVELAKMLCDSVTVLRFDVVSYLKAPDLITAFDEHRMSPNFKFGVLYQREGQLTEEDILCNNEESEEFQEFLSILGATVALQGFTGFRGGLDVCHGQTGNDAVFTSFHGREIMFHVSTKLPFTEGDTQQLQRKRHIGNDIVAVVYQEGHTPFLSDVIGSHFLHCFLVVRREEGCSSGLLQVSVTAREDVPPFGPSLPDPPIFTESSLLREFLLTKLINAEISCYKAERFSRLELRTRSSLLEGLQAELSTRSQCMIGDSPVSALSTSEGMRGVTEGSGGFIENFKRAIRVRSNSFDTLGGPRKMGGVPLPQKPKAATERDGESELAYKPPEPSFPPTDNLGSTEVKDHSSPQENT
ncbi:rap1 GTPase-activating protein 2 [Salvelinus namaycush]|uniref:Rap1 GTPase-activating protein 2 n=1 Tax=Salvelinus namaycush TaxID=8040 RepID=A0A8U0PWB9_SALNM|nr:rap1 GTPase-activating protein 2 [Salvelinus namaycush]